MSLTIVSVVPGTNNGGVAVWESSLSVAAQADDIISCRFRWRNNADIENIFWGDQAMTRRGNIENHGQNYSAIYTVVASATGTNNITAGFTNNTAVTCQAAVLRPGAGNTINYSDPVIQMFASGTYAAPSIDVSAVPSGSIVMSWFGGLAWDKDYNDVAATTWTVGGPFTLQDSVQNTGWPGVNRSYLATAIATGTVNSSWTPSVDEPQYDHVVFYITATPTGGGATIDSLDDPLRPGETYDVDTTGLAGIDAGESSFGGVPLADADASGGDGTITFQGWVHGEEYPLCPGTYDVILSDGDASVTVSRTMATPYDPDSYDEGTDTYSAYLYEDMDDVDTGENGLGKDPAIVDGVRIYQPALGPGSMNARGQFDNVPYGTYTFWARDLDGIMWTFDLVLSDSTIVGDTTPDAFSFNDQASVALGSTITSDPITVTGIDSPSPISVTGGQYSKNGGAFTSSVGTVVDGDEVRARHTSSASTNTATNTVVTIGGVSDTFTSTTIAASTAPNPFSFAAVIGATVSTQYTSNTVEISGITESVPVAIVGGQYSKNGGAYTSSAGTAIEGDEFSVRITSGPNAYDAVNATLTVGGVSATYSVRNALAGSGGSDSGALRATKLRAIKL